MHWFTQLFTQTNSVAYTAVIYALVIFSGAALGRLRIFGITFGVTIVLFSGIIISYLGFTVNEHTAHFIREFGLILFVYTIGLQVGPGFFASFQKEGLKLNLLMLIVVIADILIATAGGKETYPRPVPVVTAVVEEMRTSQTLAAANDVIAVLTPWALE